MRCWDWEISTTSDLIEVEYNFLEGEDEVRYYPDGSGLPSTPSEVELVRFTFKGTDITDLIFELVHHKLIEDLREEIRDHEENGGSYDWEDYWEKG